MNTPFERLEYVFYTKKKIFFLYLMRLKFLKKNAGEPFIE